MSAIHSSDSDDAVPRRVVYVGPEDGATRLRECLPGTSVVQSASIERLPTTPDCFVVEHAPPTFDGFAALDELGERRLATHVVFVADATHFAAAVAAGVSEFVPTDPSGSDDAASSTVSDTSNGTSRLASRVQALLASPLTSADVVDSPSVAPVVFDTTRRLLRAASPVAVFSALTTAAATVLDAPFAAVYVPRDESTLVLVAANDGAGRLPSRRLTDVSDLVRWVREGRQAERTVEISPRATAVEDRPAVEYETVRVLSLGTHGLLLVGLPDDADSDTDEGRDGSVRRLVADATVVLDRLGDHRRHRTTERELRALVDSLTAANEDLDHFTATLGREFSESLRLISGYLGLLERRHGSALSPEGLAYLRYAIDGTDRMDRLVDVLQQFAATDPEYTTLDLSAVVVRALSTLRPRVEACDATVLVGELPTVTGDEDQLVQLFENLLSHTLAHAGDRPTIVVDTHERADTWRVTVTEGGLQTPTADTGRTVPRPTSTSEDVEPRERPDLRLLVCRRIAAAHGGRAHVETTPDGGSSAVVVFPKDASRLLEVQ